MRNSLQMIQAALGDEDFVDIREKPEFETGPFKFFHAVLSGSRYRGLQPNWYFATLTEANESGGYDAAHRTARALISKAASSNPATMPLVMLSDDGGVRLADMCRSDSRDVFAIDADDLHRPRKPANPLHAPFIMAVRAKYSSTQLSVLLFQPYSPMHPVDGWKFFGRRNELDQLVNGQGNYFVVGSRMTGKTSLLKEAARLLQQTRSAQVHHVHLQHVTETHEIVQQILRTMAERDSVTAVRRSKMLDESLLESVLKKISKSHTPTVLILDELGLALQSGNQRGPDWTFAGMLREYSQSGGIRVIMSGYQEIFVKQTEYEGPFVNFAKIIRLSGFNDNEIDEFLVQPLQFWGNVSRSELLTLARNRVGRHPLLLQYFGLALFEKVARRAAASDVNDAAKQLLDSDGIEIFREPVDHLFLRTGTATERYLFLKRCRQAELSGEPLHEIEITDAWTKQSLDELGYESNYDGRRFTLERLELKALTSAVGGNPSRQRIATPIIYSYLKHAEPELDAFIHVLGEDAHLDKHQFVINSTGRPS